MDEWEQGYSDGFRDAVVTVEELAEKDPLTTVGTVLAALQAERLVLLTPGLTCEETLAEVCRKAAG